jgi:choline/glycine/proline betaine transport protein
MAAGFWGAMTALITSALLFRQHRCAEVGGGADLAAVLADFAADDVGLHKAFYLESQKQIAQMHSLAPVSGRGVAAGASA